LIIIIDALKRKHPLIAPKMWPGNTVDRHDFNKEDKLHI